MLRNFIFYFVSAIVSWISSRGACRSLSWRKAWAPTLGSPSGSGSDGCRKLSVNPSTSIRRAVTFRACIVVILTLKEGSQGMFGSMMVTRRVCLMSWRCQMGRSNSWRRTPDLSSFQRGSVRYVRRGLFCFLRSKVFSRFFDSTLGFPPSTCKTT